MPDLLSFFLWYLAVTALGLIAWPLAYRFLPNLPGRGWALSKSLGLLVAGYIFWMLGSLGFILNTTGGILFALAVLAALSIWAARQVGAGNLRAFLQRNGQYVLISEVLFFAAFAGWAYVRAHNPEIANTEKPMEFAFLNGINRSTAFPPLDPWLSGYAISYYYFGYVIVMMLARLAGTAPGVAFNLGGSLLFGLIALGSWSIVCDLIAAEKQGTEGNKETKEITSREESSFRSPNSLASPGSFVSSRALLPALLGPLFVLVIGNFGGLLEVMHSQHIFWHEPAVTSAATVENPAAEPPALESSFWKWIDLEDLDRPPTRPATIVPDRYLWWWRSSRVIRDRDLSPSETPIGWQISPGLKFLGLDGQPIDLQPIDEFPMFSFLLGDLHPHVLALPFVLLAVGFAFNLALRDFRGASPQASTPDVAASRARANSQFISAALRPFRDLGPADFLMYTVVLGALSFLNTWDFPIYLLVTAGAYALARARHEGWSWELLLDSAVLGGALLFAGILLYLPFYLGFQTQAGGLLPNIIFPTRLPQFFIMFGPLLTVVLVFVGWIVLKHPAARRANWSLLPTAALALLGAILLLAAGLAVRVFAQPELLGYVNDFLAPISLQQALQLAVVRRLTNPWTTLLLLIVIGAAVAMLVPRRPPQSPISNPAKRGASSLQLPVTNYPALSPSLMFALLLVVVGALLTLFPEFLYLKDNFGARMNTIFKFYYQAWLQWGLVAAFGAWYLSRSMGAVSRTVFQLATLFVALAGLIYPVFGVWTKTNEFKTQATLDGFAYMATFNTADYEAIRWLNDNITGAPVIAEAIGGQYSEYARVSSGTGLPAVMGWGGHEGQWRGALFGEQAGGREPDIQLLYSTRLWEEADAVLQRYDIRYVYYGPLEASKYGLAGAAKFDQFMRPVYQADGVTIYERVGLSE